MTLFISLSVSAYLKTTQPQLNLFIKNAYAEPNKELEAEKQKAWDAYKAAFNAWHEKNTIEDFIKNINPENKDSVRINIKESIDKILKIIQSDNGITKQHELMQHYHDFFYRLNTAHDKKKYADLADTFSSCQEAIINQDTESLFHSYGKVVNTYTPIIKKHCPEAEENLIKIQNLCNSEQSSEADTKEKDKNHESKSKKILQEYSLFAQAYTKKIKPSYILARSPRSPCPSKPPSSVNPLSLETIDTFEGELSSINEEKHAETARTAAETARIAAETTRTALDAIASAALTKISASDTLAVARTATAAAHAIRNTSPYYPTAVNHAQDAHRYASSAFTDTQAVTDFATALTTPPDPIATGHFNAALDVTLLPNTHQDMPTSSLKFDSDRLKTIHATKASIAKSKGSLNQRNLEAVKEITGKWESIDSSSISKHSLTKDDKKLVDKSKLDSKKMDPPIIAYSDFIDYTTVSHLMRDKKNDASGVKWEEGKKDKITNMEGLLHTFVTPLLSIKMIGDYKYKDKQHTMQPIQQANKEDGERTVIMSAAVQPDFQDNQIMMQLAELKPEELQGVDMTHIKKITIGAISNPENKKFTELMQEKEKRAEYDLALLKHMVYHLTKDHKRPGTSSHSTQKIELKNLEDLITKKFSEDSQLADSLKDKYFTVNDKNLSAEILFNSYVEQLRNEFGVLEKTCPQGYVYTIDPPSIFANAIEEEGVKWLNRLQTLAFKKLSMDKIFKNLKVIGFNDYKDKGMIQLLKQSLDSENTSISVSKITVMSKSSLFPGEGNYSPPDICKSCALVVHNNSNAFGQNIESQQMGDSMDGVFGNISDASSGLKRNRSDLLKHAVQQKALFDSTSQTP